LSGAPTIYIVDDDAAVRDSLRLLLETHDRSVRDFGSAGQLLGEVGTTAAGCLVLDYDMPAMNGLDLLAELRTRGVTMPAILITAHDGRRIERRAVAAGVVAVLEKPFRDGAIVALVAQALEADGRAARPHK
jgi:two-component system, LuxR family, response regulator FixJ